MKRVFKVISVLLLSLLLTAVAATFIIPIFLNEPLKKSLIDEFERQTDQNYVLDFAGIDVSLFKRSVSIDSIVVQPDSTSPHVQKISAASISMKGIKLWSLLSGSFPNFNSITVSRPHVEILEQDLYPSLLSGDTTGRSGDALQDLSTFTLLIENGSGTIKATDGKELFSISDLSLETGAVDINNLLDGSELLFMDDLFIQGAGLKWKMQQDFYDLTISDFSFNKQAGTFSLSNLALTPLLPKYDFSEAMGFQLDRIKLEIPEFSLSGMDLSSLADYHINADELIITEPWMEVFRNKQIERQKGLNIKPLLNELAHSIDFSIGVDSTFISGSTIIYEEHKSPSASSAAISFNDLNATVTNIRTANHPYFSEDTLNMHVETLFMDTAPLTLDVSYPLFNESDLHTVKTKLGSFDPKKARNMLERSGFVRVDDGFVESIESEFTLNSKSSSGKATVIYRDLKISFLNKNSGEQGLGEKFKDLIANTFSIKSDNSESDPHIGEVAFDREVEKSIFAYWWKSLLSGIQDTIQ